MYHSRSFQHHTGVTAPPVVGTPSPFVQFSSATMEEHQNTLNRLESQLNMIAHALADLEGEEMKYQSEQQRVLEHMARDQDEIIRRSYQCRDMENQISKRMQDEETTLATELQQLSNREVELTSELHQMEDLEQQMLELESSARDRLYVTQQQIAMFTQALQKGLNVLESDANEVKRIVTSTNRTFSNDPIVTSKALSHSPYADRSLDPITPRYHPLEVPSQPRQVHTQHIQSPPRVSSRQPRLSTPEQRAAPQQSSILQHQSQYGHSAQSYAAQPPLPHSNLPSSTSNVSFDALTIPGSQELLAACARTPMDANEINYLLRQNQAAVNALDALDNSPLHIACMNPTPSLDAIHALLLAGANTSLKNSAGLTPFHLACLNYRGDTLENDHKLKRFLVFKGAQNPNQRTSRGETAAHLCAEDDKHFDSLVFLVGAGVDAAAPAMYSSVNGSRQLTALDVAQAGGSKSAKNAEFLLLHCTN